MSNATYGMQNATYGMPDLNIDNYSLEDLLELIGAESADSKESVRSAINKVIKTFGNMQQAPVADFFQKVSFCFTFF